MTQVDQTQALELINRSRSILIAPSTPDGDSIGSALALAMVLQKMGRKAVVICSDDVPTYLQFLPFVSTIKKEFPTSNDFVISLSTANADVDHLKYEVEPGKINIIVTPKQGVFAPADISIQSGSSDVDLIITVDTGDLVQLGKFYENNKSFFEKTPLLNIDHHASNGRFGTHNFLNFGVAATTQMLTPLLLELEKQSGQELIDEDIATLLLVGIITDTGSFQHSNTSPEAFEVAADLLERGARQQEIIKHIFKTKSLATLKLWGRTLSKIVYEDNLVYSTITIQDLEETGALSEDSGAIIDELLSNAPDAEVAMLLKEKEPGFISGSLRAPGSKADVSEIAGRMGGGGHRKAAGFRIKGKTMEEAVAYTKETIAQYLSEVNGETQPLAEVPKASGALFPGLITKPQASVPVPSVGGEDMLLEHFRKAQLSPEEERIREQSVRFFQDVDGQQKTVGDVLTEMSQN